MAKMTVTRGGRRAGRTPKMIEEHVGIRVYGGNLYMIFTDERGFGASRFEIKVSPETFADLAQGMMRADAEYAIMAFGVALKGGTPEPLEPGKAWAPGLP